MRRTLLTGMVVAWLCTVFATTGVAQNHKNKSASLTPADRFAYSHHQKKGRRHHPARIGVRPYYLVDDMDEGALKQRLQACAANRKTFKSSQWSIGHRGAPLQFPEHTEESYRAAAFQGAGILECDVTFTKDRELVCRHSQCDLHTTTNILATPLAEKCSIPFTPATDTTPATAQCCTSDITLAEFKTLKGKMDAANASATTVDEYLGGTAAWRTDLYTQNATLLTHAESIELFKELGVGFTPELKSPAVDMPYEGDYSQEAYAAQMIEEYRAAAVPARRVWAQSFNYEDVKYWIDNYPAFGRQAVYLDDRVYNDADFMPSPSDFDAKRADGLNIVAPPMWALLATDSFGDIVASEYATMAKAAGLDIITWTAKRSGPLASGGGWYFQTTTDVINNDGDVFNVLHALNKEVGIIGLFSDWPATTTFYANCMGLK